jgi:rhodanese-related sulfurtransferase/DNA-binding transcriptional ArsR family regulator
LNTISGATALSNLVNPKRAVYENLARIGTALSSAVRLELLELVAQGERSVDELSTLTGATVANTSQHLQKLTQAGLRVGRQEAQFVRYRLAGDEVVALIDALGATGRAYLDDVDRIVRLYFTAKDDLEPVESEELVRRVRGGEVTVLDGRPGEEYAAGHIPGARSIPVGELAQRLKELPRDRDVVAYCRGPYCGMAAEAVAILRRKGFTAHRLEHGVADWRARGWRVATSRALVRSPRRSGARA